MEVKSLKVNYQQQNIIDQLDVQFKKAAITSIIGRNGSGKSTLLKAMAQLIDHTGTVILNGREIETYSTKELARHLSLLMQESQLAAPITVKELVAMGRYPHQKGRYLSASDEEKITWAMAETGTLHLQDKEVDELSGGQRQRVWIAMALAQESEYLLLDEPTTYLDLESQLEILTLVRRLQQEMHTTVIMVLHDINQVARFSDEIIALEEGQIKAQGSVDEVMNAALLSDLYHLDITVEYDELYLCPQMTHYTLRKDGTGE